MIRSATASSTRCREVFPSAGLWLRLPELELGFDLELEFALVLEPDLALLAAGDAVVMGRFSPSESVLNWSGAFPAGFGGNGHGAGCPSGLSEPQCGFSPGFQDNLYGLR